jgi:hypothetical protein
MSAGAPGSARLTTRRWFLRTVGIGVAGAALVAASGRDLAAGLISWMFPAPLMRSTFAARLDETFQVRTSAASVELRLVKAEPLHSAAPSPASADHSFALLFRGPADQPLAQNTYNFAHSRIGSFPLFIVPMAVEHDARYYQAIFNRQQA